MFIALRQVFESISVELRPDFIFYLSLVIALHSEAVCSLDFICMSSAIFYFSDCTVYCCTQSCPVQGDFRVFQS